MSVSDLVMWLRAQLDEDERVVASLPDHVYAIKKASASDLVASECMGYPGEQYLEIMPTRALADVEAKRRILDLYEASAKRDDWMRDSGSTPLRAATAAYYLAVKAIALPYADRPGYREEWRP